MKFLEGHPRPFFHTAVLTQEGRVNYLYCPGSDDLAKHEASSIGGTVKSVKRGEEYLDSRGRKLIHGNSQSGGGDCRAHRAKEG